MSWLSQAKRHHTQCNLPVFHLESGEYAVVRWPLAGEDLAETWVRERVPQLVPAGARIVFALPETMPSRVRRNYGWLGSMIPQSTILQWLRAQCGVSAAEVHKVCARMKLQANQRFLAQPAATRRLLPVVAALASRADWLLVSSTGCSAATAQQLTAAVNECRQQGTRVLEFQFPLADPSGSPPRRWSAPLCEGGEMFEVDPPSAASQAA